MDLNRLRNAIAAVVRELFPNLDYLGVYTYVVSSFDAAGQTADLQPLNPKKLPTLTKIPIRTPGLRVKLVPKDEVLVGFQDGDPSRPYVASLMTAKSYTDALAVGRQGDMTISGGNGVVAALYPMPGNSSPSVLPGVPYFISFGAVTDPLSPPTPPPPPAQGPLYGVLGSGSVFVKSK